MNSIAQRYILVLLTIITVLCYYFILFSSVDTVARSRPANEKTQEASSVKRAGEGENYDSYFSKCDPRIHQLVDRYFKPHKRGITSDMISDAIFKIERMPFDSMVLFQVIQNKIYVDKRRLDRVPWDTQRYEFVLNRLHEFIVKRRLACRMGRKMIPSLSECEKDFEFVAVYIQLNLILSLISWGCRTLRTVNPTGLAEIPSLIPIGPSKRVL